MCAKSLQSCLFATLWTTALQAPLSMGFSRQEHWSGLPCPPPGNLPDSGIEHGSLMSPAFAGGFFTTRATREAPIHGGPNKTSGPLLKCVNSGMQQVYTEKENYILLPLTVKWITSVEALKMLGTINRWMDKEVVGHIHNGILLSHEKEWIWVNCNEVDEPRAWYSGWSKSEKQILFIKTYMDSRKTVLMNLFTGKE